MKLVIRSENEEKVRMAVKVVGGCLAVAGVVLLIRELPNLVRFARMESM
jgi:hypothetical protein